MQRGVIQALKQSRRVPTGKHERPGTLANLQHPGMNKGSHRLSDRISANTQRVTELAFGRNSHPRRPVAGMDLRPHLLDYPLYKRRA
jgi:hypothetical protein